MLPAPVIFEVTVRAVKATLESVNWIREQAL
jgi:hypothetical protein